MRPPHARPCLLSNLPTPDSRDDAPCQEDCRSRAQGSAIGEALGALAADKRFEEAQQAAHRRLGRKAGDPEAGDAGRLVAPPTCPDRTVTLYRRLSELDDADVLTLLAVAVAETLAVGTDLVDALGGDLALDVLQDWQPDTALFALIRDRDTLDAMLAEVAGKQAATSYLTATGTRKKQIIQNALTGTSRRNRRRNTPGAR
jgi:ParB family chromosome partitioning protein